MSDLEKQQADNIDKSDNNYQKSLGEDRKKASIEIERKLGKTRRFSPRGKFIMAGETKEIIEKITKEAPITPEELEVRKNTIIKYMKKASGIDGELDEYELLKFVRHRKQIVELAMTDISEDEKYGDIRKATQWALGIVEKGYSLDAQKRDESLKVIAESLQSTDKKKARYARMALDFLSGKDKAEIVKLLPSGLILSLNKDGYLSPGDIELGKENLTTLQKETYAKNYLKFKRKMAKKARYLKKKSNLATNKAVEMLSAKGLGIAGGKVFGWLTIIGNGISHYQDPMGLATNEYLYLGTLGVLGSDYLQSDKTLKQTFAPKSKREQWRKEQALENLAYVHNISPKGWRKFFEFKDGATTQVFYDYTQYIKNENGSYNTPKFGGKQFLEYMEKRGEKEPKVKEMSELFRKLRSQDPSVEDDENLMRLLLAFTDLKIGEAKNTAHIRYEKFLKESLKA